MNNINFSDTNDMDLENMLDMAIGKISSMTMMLTGDGFDTFMDMDEDRQRGYFWTMNSVTYEIQQIRNEMNERGMVFLKKNQE